MRTWLALFLLLVTVTSAGARALAGLPGVEVVDPETVLAEHTIVGPEGALLFRDPSGVWVRLITSTEDPEIRNPGEGSFFPAPESQVEAAIRALPPELLDQLEVRVFLLPFPRAGMIGSSADGQAIYITPGVRLYTPAEVHYLVTHEIGHVFHRRHLPYGDPLWNRYRQIRGLEDEGRFSFDGAHADRPQEIFAEDFRVLFGGELARGDGSVENRDVRSPSEVPGLVEFIRAFVPAPSDAAGYADTRLIARARPNPIRAGDRLSFRLPAGGAVRSAFIVDIGGRRWADLALRRDGDGWGTTLPRDLGAGSYWVRVEPASGPPLTIPLRVLGAGNP